TSTEIKLAYREALALLQTSHYQEIGNYLSPMVARIDAAAKRMSHSFSVLENFDKKIEYDNLLLSKSGRTVMVYQPARSTSDRCQTTGAIIPLDELSPEPGLIRSPGEAIPLTSERDEQADNSDGAVYDNRRKWNRHTLSLPVYVTGHD